MDLVASSTSVTRASLERSLGSVSLTRSTRASSTNRCLSIRQSARSKPSANMPRAARWVSCSSAAFRAASSGAESRASYSCATSEKPMPNAENTAARPGMTTRDTPEASATLQAMKGPAPPKAARVVSAVMPVYPFNAAATVAAQAASIASAAFSGVRPEWLRDILQDRRPCPIDVDLQFAAKICARIEQPHHQKGVGDGRLLAAESEAGGARRAADALGADLDLAVDDLDDRGAADAGAEHVAQRQRGGDPLDETPTICAHVTLLDEADVGCRPADVHAEQAIEFVVSGQGFEALGAAARTRRVGLHRRSARYAR